jgi:hypothetical protein
MILATAAGVSAQIPLESDTMKVIDSYGRPGDTVEVSLYIANYSIAVYAYTARVVFDAAILQPISAACFERGCSLEFTSGVPHQDSAMVILAYTFDPPSSAIPPGSGPVAKMRFRVKPAAQYNMSTTIRFVDFGTEFVNGWSDTLAEFYVPRLVAGNFTVTGGIGNQSPVIGNIGSQQVAEGQTLQFYVDAHDPNGDPITLSAQNLPDNSSFPTVQGDSSVTGLFAFSPTFEQGPDTFDVDFVAIDDHNNTTRLTVPIVVLDQPNDRLVINSGQGGVPGATSRDIDVNLLNSRAIFGIQFKYYYDETQVEISNILQVERSLDLGFWTSTPNPGEIIVLIFSAGLDPIEAGDGPIVKFVANVNSSAFFGRTSVVLDSAVEVIDSVGTSRRLVTEDGYFTVDRFGDGNLDEVVNVGDCITIVAFIIERMDLNIRQFDAADINRDGRVTVADLQEVINEILQLPTMPGPSPALYPVVVELTEDPTRVDNLVTVGLMADVTTEAAAVQYKIAFNPDRIEPVGAQPGEIVSGLQFDSNVSEGTMSGVVYDLTGATFGPATGQLANFTFRLLDGDLRRGDLVISEFEIVDRGAARIPSEIKGQLPTQIALNQNYPNPFNAATNISFDLPHEGDVELSVYDLLGRQIAILVDGRLSAGNHIFRWDGRADDGAEMATGVFFYRLRSDGFDETKKMLLVK